MRLVIVQDRVPHFIQNTFIALCIFSKILYQMVMKHLLY